MSRPLAHIQTPNSRLSGDDSGFQTTHHSLDSSVAFDS